MNFTNAIPEGAQHNCAPCTQCEEGARYFAAHYSDVKTLRDVTMEQLQEHEAELPDIVAKRARFIIEENQRVLEFATALSHNDRDAITCLTTASYIGARDLFEISSKEMEAMMTAMQSGTGVIWARQAGAGFGGCMVAFIEAKHVEDFSEHIHRTYLHATAIQPDVYVVQAAPGAGVLQHYSDALTINRSVKAKL